MSRTASDRYQRQLLELVKQPGNNQCADCKAANPRWASWDQGVFLCVKCASMHRKIGSHITKVKSLTLDTWNKDQVDNMRKLGNVKVNSLLNPDERRNPPPPPDSDDSRNSELERFVRNKYEYKVYQDFDHPAPPSPAPTPPLARSNLPPSRYNGIPSLSNVPPPPVRTDSAPRQPVYSPPPGPPPPPSLPARQSSSSFASPTFSPSATTTPTVPPSLPTRKLPKSVRFPTSPPVQIPSPPDSDDDDDDEAHQDSYGRLTKRPRSESRHRSLSASSTRSILVRTALNREIPIDWAALTREPTWTVDEDGNEDVPLQALGALGVKGAQVGLVGIPTSSHHPQPQGYLTPIAMYGVDPNQHNPQGGGGGGIAPLMPQFTGSAKGYLHQLHAGTFQAQNNGGGVTTPQMLVPQMTGSVSKNYAHHAGGGGVDGDSFMKMFQPPPSSNPNSDFSRDGGSNQYQSGYASTTNGSQFGGANAQQQQAPMNRTTNPFTQFAQSQPRQAHQAQAQAQLQPPSNTSNPTSIWDDLTSLSPSPSSTPQPLPRNPSPTQPLRPQLTGFIPSSSFGQQLARESSPAPRPENQRSTSPAQPSPLKPQYTGFVPSSSFGQSLHPPHQPGAPPAPQPLQPQRTGFVPSSSFGQQLAKDLSTGGGGSDSTATTPNRVDSPGLFDLGNGTGTASASNSTTTTRSEQPSHDLFDFDLFAPRTTSSFTSNPSDQLQPPQPQFAQPTGGGGGVVRTSSPSNPFLNFSNQLSNALPPPSASHQQPQQQPYSHSNGSTMMQLPQTTGYGGAANPFFSQQQQQQHQAPPRQVQLQPQSTGYHPQQQQFQQQQQPQQMMMRPQLTGFAAGGAGGNTNPFLMMGGGGGGANQNGNMYGNGYR